MACASSSALARWPALAAMTASAAMLFFGTGVEPLWWATWLAPLPVLLAAQRSSWRMALLLCLGAWMIGGSNLWPYLHGTLGLPVAIALLAIVTPAWHFAVATLLSRALARHGQPWAAVFALPAAWVGADFLDASLSPHGTFGNLAYTQMDNLPVLQIASVTGLWGVDFVLMLFPSALAILLCHAATRRWRIGLVVAMTALAAALLSFGHWRLSSSTAGAPLRLALLATDAPAHPLPVQDPAVQDMLAAVEQAIAAASRQRPQLLLLPETILAVDESRSSELRERLQRVATREKVTLVVGIDDRDGDSELNAAWVFPSNGAPASSYAKHHLLPGFERRYRPGRELLLQDLGDLRWGVAICKDMDFVGLPREYARQGAGLLLVPAWDFKRDGWLHSRMAVMRGIENGYAVARSARNGRITLSDSRGRMLADVASAEARVTSRVLDLVLRAEPTLYARLGDWFAWISLGTALACLLWLWISWRRRSACARTTRKDRE